ncbi:redoxin domain-containing protein [Pilimelia columellifera]|uniref:Protein disulfide oxidoreductase n=1 Tax=Pilimelia columellifera subsp. columellifera TaxID=706583 RepID=A0ABN3NQ36_9ACTN
MPRPMPGPRLAGAGRLAAGRRWLVALVMVALAGVTGCAGPEPGATEPASGERAAVPSGEASATGGASAAPATVLRFSGRTLDGRDFDGASLAGKPAMLWFWAPFCATCAGQAPTVMDLADRYQGRVSVLGVAGLGDAKEMREFVDDTEISALPQVNDSGGVLWRRFGVVEQSVYVLIDASGKVTHKGWLDSVDIERAVRELAA